MSNRVEYRRELAEVAALRPRTRGDCHRVRLALVADLDDDDPMRIHRPCPFVSCAHHLHVDVHETPQGRATVTILGGDIAHTCALDVVDEHPDGVSREEVARVLRVSEERTRIFDRQIEKRLREAGAFEEWQGHRGERGEA